MRQPKISDQGYLEPVTRKTKNCHFGQLVPPYHVCTYVCIDMDMKQLAGLHSNCFQQQL
jgi:hypothetical protein